MSPNTSISSRFESFIPKSSIDWKCLLQEVKLLYIRRQYKQCATRASDLLHVAHEPIDPVYKTYLYFYSAISYEAMGRAAHNYSSKKISLLNSALDYFITCSAILPSPIASMCDEDDSTPVSFSDSTFTSSDRPSSSASLMSDITDIIDKSMNSMADDPFMSDTDTSVESPFTFKLQAHVHEPPLVPPPLKVQKPTDTLHSLRLATGDSDDSASASSKTSITDRSARAHRPPPLPIKIVPFGLSNSRRQREESRVDTGKIQPSLRRHTPAKSSVGWEPTSRSLDESIQRYNSGIESLRAEVNASIASIHNLIDEVTDIQDVRRSTHSVRRSASFWSFSPIKEGNSRVPSESISFSRRSSATRETIDQRIVRLRANGWNSVGLRDVKRGWKGTEYYQAYCTAVLAELYRGQ